MELFFEEAVPPTSKDSSVFIRILRGMYELCSIIQRSAHVDLEVSCDQEFLTSACVLSLAKYGGERH